MIVYVALATRCEAQGRAADAILAIEESVTVYRRLASVNPDAYAAELAADLHALAIQATRAGRSGGDTSLHLRRVNPLHLTDFLRQVQHQGIQVVLLHGYPYHRQAAYLAHAFPHAWVDVGLSLNYVGASAPRVLSEVLELAPFGKVLFSTDAYLPELYHLGAALFRRAMDGLCEQAVAAGEWSASDAERVTRMVAGGNSRRLYRRLVS